MNAYSLLQLQLDETVRGLETTPQPAARYGLFSGKTGAAFCYFQFAEFFRTQENKQTARRLVEEVLAVLPSLRDISLADGWAGIGWGLETMRQNGYELPDTAEALAFIDDEIYKYSTFRKSPDLSLEKGMLGRLLYLTSRLSAVADAPFRYRSLLLQECITLLMADLQTVVFIANPQLQARYAVFFQRLRRAGWYPDNAKKWLLAFRAHVEQLYADATFLPTGGAYLLRTYAWLAQQTRTPEMERQVARWEKQFSIRLLPVSEEIAVAESTSLPPDSWPAFSLTLPLKKGQVSLANSYLLIQTNSLI